MVIPAIAGASDNDEGRSKVRLSADGNINAGDAVRVKPVIAGTKENAESRYKVSSTTGNDGTTGFAGSRICKKGPFREWVKTKRNVPESGEIVDSSVAWGFSDPKNPKGKGVPQQAERVCPASAGIKENADVLQSAPVLEGSALTRPAPCLFDKNTHSEFSILGLGVDNPATVGLRCKHRSFKARVRGGEGQGSYSYPQLEITFCEHCPFTDLLNWMGR